ncbi:MAG: hypothetical protein ACFFB5_18045 [Promethearchaeota archaeon]
MTSLDTLMSVLKSKCTPMAAIQNTPQNILLVVTSKDFWDCLQVLDKNDITFRFMERRETSLDVHLSLNLSIQEIHFQVTFRIVDYSLSLVHGLSSFFPHATAFIQEIEGLPEDNNENK